MFRLLFSACRESDPLPDKKPDQVETGVEAENYSCEKKFESEPLTYYYLVTINHLDIEENLLKLNHAHANNVMGETVFDFAKR